jgi:D-hydroxyproline dehydrogenase subunit beta
MPEPDFIGIDTVPMAALPSFEQEQDRRAAGPPLDHWPGPCLAIPTALRVRGKVKFGNDTICGHGPSGVFRASMAAFLTMTRECLIIGAGLIGASLAFRLSQAGVAVRVLEAGLPASEASGRSFGWINASFYLSPAHHQLRADAIAAHHRLSRDLPGSGHRWGGALWWEETGPGFDAMAGALRALGYPVEALSRADVARREPSLAVLPERALLFPAEGAVDAADLTRTLLRAAASHGAEVMTGVGVTGLIQSGGQVLGAETTLGPLRSETVVLAAGVGAAALLARVGLHLPMLHRPGVMLRSQPVSLRLAHILVTPDQEIRQDACGRLLAPAVAGHQSDTGAGVADMSAMAGATLARLGRLFGLLDLRAERVGHALRPVPGDGLPAYGPVKGCPGLWLAVMHSGVTLAPLVAEHMAAQILGQGSVPTDFLPDRLLQAI